LNEQARSTRDEAARLKIRELLVANRPARPWPPRLLRIDHESVVFTNGQALETAPVRPNLLALMGLLRESLGREVDIALLGETRLKEKIIREGELWTV
jgi:hypothetical protein